GILLFLFVSFVCFVVKYGLSPPQRRELGGRRPPPAEQEGKVDPPQGHVNQEDQRRRYDQERPQRRRPRFGSRRRLEDLLWRRIVHSARHPRHGAQQILVRRLEPQLLGVPNDQPARLL